MKLPKLGALVSLWVLFASERNEWMNMRILYVAKLQRICNELQEVRTKHGHYCQTDLMRSGHDQVLHIKRVAASS